PPQIPRAPTPHHNQKYFAHAFWESITYDQVSPANYLKSQTHAHPQKPYDSESDHHESYKKYNQPYYPASLTKFLPTFSHEAQTYNNSSPENSFPRKHDSKNRWYL